MKASRNSCRLRTVFVGLALVVVVEAVAISIGAGNRVLGGTDGAVYDQLARNLAYHGAFSSATAAPLSPSVFRTPGYPGFLAAAHLVAGNAAGVVRAGQVVLIGLTAALLWWVANVTFGRRVAVVAALLCVTYLPLLWLAREHLSDVLATFLTVAAIALLLLVRDRRDGFGHLGFAGVGVVIALAALVRPELAGIAAVIALCVTIWPAAAGRRVAVLRVCAMLAVFAVALLPWAVRNYDLTHRVVPLGAASGSSLYASALQWNGSISMQFNVADWRRDRAGESSVVDPVTARDQAHHRSAATIEVDINGALVKAARHLGAGLRVTDIVRRLPKRVAYLWSVGDEPPAGAYSLWHWIDRLQYAAILALTLLGLVVTARRGGRAAADWWARAWPLLAVALYFTAVHLVFHVQARYTMPARPLLIVFAAAGLVWLFDAGRDAGRLVRRRAAVPA